MNVKNDFMRPYERVIYLVLIVFLVIALITISTCNKNTASNNEFLKMQVTALTTDIEDLGGRITDQNEELNLKASEIKAKKKQIEDLISKGLIDAAEAQKRIRQLKKEISELNAAVILQKQTNDSNSSSMQQTINELSNDKNALQKQVNDLREELNRMSVSQPVVNTGYEPIGIDVLSGTKISRSTVTIDCELYKEAAKDEKIYVEVLDENGNNVNPQNQIFSFKILRGGRKYNGSITNSSGTTFRPGKRYKLLFKNSNYEIVQTHTVTVPSFIFGSGIKNE